MIDKKKYLYLTQKNWVNTWVNGGRVPINLASNYRSDERKGTLTPDEVLQRKLRGTSEDVLKRVIKFDDSNTIDLRVGTIKFGNQEVGKDISFNQSQEDGLILCFCNECNRKIQERFKKEACVEIKDIFKLMENLNSQIGVPAIAGNCEYTPTFERNHFLKGIEDKWQNEFRLFWPYKEPIEVNIYPNTATQVFY